MQLAPPSAPWAWLLLPGSQYAQATGQGCRACQFLKGQPVTLQAAFPSFRPCWLGPLTLELFQDLGICALSFFSKRKHCMQRLHDAMSICLASAVLTGKVSPGRWQGMMGASPAPGRVAGYAIILFYQPCCLTRAPFLGDQNLVLFPFPLPGKYCQQTFMWSCLLKQWQAVPCAPYFAEG